MQQITLLEKEKKNLYDNYLTYKIDYVTWLPIEIINGFQKCSNYALTNLLFGLCRFVWIIDACHFS
jgi:uncharacterized protein YehS (DUF1456 family)